MKLANAVLDSKKAQALLIGGVVAVFGQKLGMTEEQAGDLVNIFMAYLVAVGVQDAGTAIAKKAAPSGGEVVP